MNDVPSLVPFDFGATRSFISFVLCKRYDEAFGDLNYLLEVEITDDHLVQVSRVHQGCVVELFSEWYPIDLVSNPLHVSRVIVGMD